MPSPLLLDLERLEPVFRRVCPETLPVGSVHGSVRGVGRLLRNPRIVRIFVCPVRRPVPCCGIPGRGRPYDQRFEHMKKIVNPWRGMEGYRCFGCDPHSERGLRMEFYEEGEQIVCRWHPRPEFQGWVNTLHGGIQATLAD